MEELKHELEKLAKTYVDTPEKEEKILIPFIKRLLELPMKERRKMIPTIGELQYERGEGWMTCCDPARRRFLAAIEFISANKREMTMAYEIDFELLCKLLQLYRPTWLSDFINGNHSFYNFNLNYQELMQLVDLGYIKELSPKLLGQMVPLADQNKIFQQQRRRDFRQQPTAETGNHLKRAYLVRLRI